MNDPQNEAKISLEELQKKIDELKHLSGTGSSAPATAEIAMLTEQLNRMLAEAHRNLSPWQRVLLARHPQRPYTLDYIGRIFTDFMELSGDRRFRDDKAIVGGFAKLDGKPVMVIGTQKGRDMKDNLLHNFGWPNPEGYRKALRLAMLADKARCPVITFIDTPGAYPGVSSEERHIAEAIAVNLRDMFKLGVPVISVVIGEGGSGGALGIGICNRMLVLENAYYSVITPEGCAAILWKDRSFAPQAAECLQLTADRLLELGVADAIVPEPPGGAHRDWDAAAAAVATELRRQFLELAPLSAAELREQRYEKFRAIGKFVLAEAEPPKPAPGAAADDGGDAAGETEKEGTSPSVSSDGGDAEELASARTRRRKKSE